jgi:5-methylcytosine-specific restriction endonuclease McrA
MKANPQQNVRNRHARRARDAAAPGHHSRADLINIRAWQGGRCAYCGCAENLHLDHAVPLARGGSNWPWNLQYLCAQHNVAKGTKTDSEYRREIGLPETPWLSLTFWSAALFLTPEVLLGEHAFAGRNSATSI